MDEMTQAQVDTLKAEIAEALDDLKSIMDSVEVGDDMGRIADRIFYATRFSLDDEV